MSLRKEFIIVVRVSKNCRCTPQYEIFLKSLLPFDFFCATGQTDGKSNFSRPSTAKLTLWKMTKAYTRGVVSAVKRKNVGLISSDQENVQYLYRRNEWRRTE